MEVLIKDVFDVEKDKHVVKVCLWIGWKPSKAACGGKCSG
jgi:hypothetical protein